MSSALGAALAAMALWRVDIGTDTAAGAEAATLLVA